MAKVLYQWLIRGKDRTTSLTDYYESEEEMDRLDPDIKRNFTIVCRVDETAIVDKNMIKEILDRRGRIWA